MSEISNLLLKLQRIEKCHLQVNNRMVMESRFGIAIVSIACPIDRALLTDRRRSKQRLCQTRETKRADHCNRQNNGITNKYDCGRKVGRNHIQILKTKKKFFGVLFGFLL